MIEPPTADFLLQIGKKMLEEDQDIDPTLLFNDPKSGKGMMMPCISMHPLQGLAAVKTAIEMGQFDQPDWIALLTDSYHTNGDRDTVEEMTDHAGSLKERFEAGDNRVGEALVVHCVSKVGTIFYAQRPYARIDGGFIWEDVQDYSTEFEKLGGIVVEGMRAVIGVSDSVEGS